MCNCWLGCQFSLSANTCRSVIPTQRQVKARSCRRRSELQKETPEIHHLLNQPPVDGSADWWAKGGCWAIGFHFKSIAANSIFFLLPISDISLETSSVPWAEAVNSNFSPVDFGLTRNEYRPSLSNSSVFSNPDMSLSEGGIWLMIQAAMGWDLLINFPS